MVLVPTNLPGLQLKRTAVDVHAQPQAVAERHRQQTLEETSKSQRFYHCHRR